MYTHIFGSRVHWSGPSPPSQLSPIVLNSFLDFVFQLTTPKLLQVTPDITKPTLPSIENCEHGTEKLLPKTQVNEDFV